MLAQMKRVTGRLEKKSDEVENLQVTIHSATELYAANADGTSDAYVIFKMGKSGRTRKTSTKLKTLNPEWEEEFSVKLKNLKNGKISDSLEIVIKDHNLVEPDVIIGRAYVPLNKLAKGEAKTETFPVVHPKEQGQSGSLTLTVARIPKVVSENAVVRAVRKKLIATMLYAKWQMASWGIEAELSVEAKIVFVKMVLKVTNEREKKSLQELAYEAENALRAARNDPLENELDEDVSEDPEKEQPPSMFKKTLDKGMSKLGETLKNTRDQFIEHGLTGAVAAGFNFEFAEMEIQLMVETTAKLEDMKRIRNRG